MSSHVYFQAAQTILILRKCTSLLHAREKKNVHMEEETEPLKS